MRCEDEKWRPVAFISKLLNKVERNYEIHNREMLAIIRCLDEWRHLLEGAQSKFEIWSVSQTSFGHISTNSSTIPTVSKPA